MLESFGSSEGFGSLSSRRVAVPSQETVRLVEIYHFVVPDLELESRNVAVAAGQEISLRTT